MPGTLCSPEERSGALKFQLKLSPGAEALYQRRKQAAVVSQIFAKKSVEITQHVVFPPNSLTKGTTRRRSLLTQTICEAILEKMEEKRHCWECRRRQLVCDFTQPGCKRCRNSGTECPGYGATKPMSLRWLKPGKVKSKVRSKKKDIKKAPTEIQELPPANNSEEIISYSHLELNFDAHALVEATEYCT